MFFVSFVLALALTLTGAAQAATAVSLGTADSYAILAGSTVTNTGSSVISGDLGLSPGTSVTGFPPGTVSGTQHITDTAAATAQTDLTTAYNNAAGQGPTSPIVADLGGQTLTPGIYNSASSIALTGALTLDAGGNANAIFIFQAGSTLTTAGSSSVVLTNGAQACNVFWQVGSSATLGTNSTFKGNILALTSATLTTGANVEGRVLARNGAVTLDTNTVTVPTCTGTLRVIKTVVNDNGGTTVASGFNLHVKQAGTDVAGSPAVGVVTPGRSYALTAGTYVVSEDANAAYAQTFSGDCSANGTVTVAARDALTCTVTNNDIASAVAAPTNSNTNTSANTNTNTTNTNTTNTNTTNTNIGVNENTNASGGGPLLPNTGVGPSSGSTGGGNILWELPAILAAISIAVVLVRRRLTE